MSGNDELYNMREREAEYGRMILDEIDEEIKNEEKNAQEKLEEHSIPANSLIFYEAEGIDLRKEYKELLEILAKYVHDDNWAAWMKHIKTKEIGRRLWAPLTTKKHIQIEYMNDDVLRWERQMNTLYEDLPESEKESDRELAEKLIGILARNGYLIKKIDIHKEIKL